ncbi:hypothetical protein ACLOJK_002599 [Asimina triloba]
MLAMRSRSQTRQDRSPSLAPASRSVTVRSQGVNDPSASSSHAVLPCLHLPTIHSTTSTVVSSSYAWTVTSRPPQQSRARDLIPSVRNRSSSTSSPFAQIQPAVSVQPCFDGHDRTHHHPSASASSVRPHPAGPPICSKRPSSMGITPTSGHPHPASRL